MFRASTLLIATLALAPACVKETYLPTITVYACSARDAQIHTILAGYRGAFPIVLTLPSGERVYFQGGNIAPAHYDGPVCQ